MSGPDAPDRDGVGYRKPPARTRFAKGQSGNPKGRPRGRGKELPYDAVLGQVVSVVEGGVERRITAAEAFLLQITKRALGGDGSAARVALVAIEEARAARAASSRGKGLEFTIVIVRPGSVNSALSPLRMAKKLDPLRPSARMTLEPWLVEAALARLGDRTLTSDEQAEVVRATRNPHKVKWPVWWEHRSIRSHGP